MKKPPDVKYLGAITAENAPKRFQRSIESLELRIKEHLDHPKINGWKRALARGKRQQAEAEAKRKSSG